MTITSPLVLRQLILTGVLGLVAASCGNNATKFSTDSSTIDRAGKAYQKRPVKGSENDANGNAAIETGSEYASNPDAGDSTAKTTSNKEVDADADGLWVEKEFFVESQKTEGVVDQFQLRSNDQVKSLVPPWVVLPKEAQLGSQSVSQSREFKKQQGSTIAGAPQTEYASQSSSGILDIVLVVDNSGSMSQEQAAMKTGLKSLLSYVDNTNWNLHVVSTDSVNGIYRGANSIITKADASRQTKFEQVLNEMGTSGSGNEMGIFAGASALIGRHLADSKGKFENLNPYSKSSWVRDNGNVAVIVLSDEDNCSNAAGCKDTVKFTKCEVPNANGVLQSYTWNSQDCLVGTLRKMGKIPKKDARIYSIVKKDSTCTEAATIGTTYMKASEETGGVSGQICAKNSAGELDYSGVLTTISKDMQESLKSVYELKLAPNPSTVKAFVNDQEVPAGGLKIVGKTVEFLAGYIPSSGSTIKFAYKTPDVSSGLFNRVSLGMDALAGSIQVELDNGSGSISPLASGWEYAASSKEIVFQANPPDNSIVIVKFMDAPAKLSQFALPASHWNTKTVNTGLELVLSSAGLADRIVPAGDYSFDGTVVKFLSSVPNYGESVKLRWKENDVALKELALEGNIVADSVSCHIQNSDATVVREVKPCVYEGGVVKFGSLLEAGLQLGWQLKVNYMTSLLLGDSFPLSKGGTRLVASSPKLKAFPSLMECSGSKLALNADLSVASPKDCSLVNESKVEISYDVVSGSGIPQEFKFFSQPISALAWEVALISHAGSKSILSASDYEILGNLSVKLKTPPAPLSKVVIRAKVP